MGKKINRGLDIRHVREGTWLIWEKIPRCLVPHFLISTSIKIMYGHDPIHSCCLKTGCTIPLTNMQSNFTYGCTIIIRNCTHAIFNCHLCRRYIL